MLTFSFILYVVIGGVIGERILFERTSPEAGMTTQECLSMLELYDVDQIQILQLTEKGLRPLLFCEVGDVRAPQPRSPFVY